MASAQPFPFASLPRWTREEAARARALARRLAPARPSLAPVPAPLAALLGGPAQARSQPPRVAQRAALERARRGLAVVALFEHHALGPVALVLERPFALVLAARALGAAPEEARVQALAGAFGPEQEGALALLLAQSAVQLCAPSPPPVLRAVSSVLSDGLEALDAEALALWPWRVALGQEEGGEALLVVSEERLLRAAQPDLAPAELGSLALSARVVLAREGLSAAQLATLQPGDVLVPGPGLRARGDGELEGSAALCLGALDVPVTLAGRSATVSAPAPPRRSTVNPTDDAAPSEALTDPSAAAVDPSRLGELAVEVELVAARGRFTLAEVAQWRVGEVVTLPAPLGEPVEVVAGGRVVALGELVVVEGALGVRLTELR